jgi:radical SAM superfamily enzyme YgiQ (UPF0313 family)
MPRSPDAAGRWLDANLHRFDGPAQYLGDEPGSLLAEYGGDRERLWRERSAVRLLLAASWDYAQAAGNMAIPAVYRAVIEAAPGNLADRWYLPATPRDLDLLDKAGLGVFGIETRHPLRDFDVVATSISYPVLFQNFSSYLARSGVPLRRAAREEKPGAWPMVMAGGQAYCAPEFMSAVFDVVWLGEAEDAEGTPGGIGEVFEVIACLKADGSWQRDRAGCYRALARQFNHLYFPQFTAFSYRYEDRGLPELTKMVSGYWPVLEGMRYPHRKRHVADLDQMRPLTKMPVLYTDPGMGSGDTEIARGCPAWCPFCRLGWVTKPARQHSVGYIAGAAGQLRRNMGSVDIALVAPDPPMHTQRKAVVAALLEQVTDEVDASSMRVDDYLADEDFSLLMAIGGADSLTLGLEGNSQRMRDLAGKGLADDDVCRVVSKAIRSGIRRIKLYMISNWPGEDEHDVMRVVGLARRLADIRVQLGCPDVRIQFSWTPLLIEAATPLQWFGVTAPDYTLQRAMDMLRDLHIDLKLGTKANPAKLAFFQACQRASREAGEALADVIEGIGTASWGGFPADMASRLDAALIARGFRNGLADLFGERFEHDLLGWEHIDTGVDKALLWRVYRDMVEFLEGTDSAAYDEQYDGATSGNEWVPRCDQSCQGRACGACDRKDLRIRTKMIRAAAAERDLETEPVIPVDHTTVACRVRFAVHRPADAHRFASAEFLRFHIRAAAFRAAEASGLPPIAKREVRLASDPLAYRDRSAGLDYAEIGVTRPPGEELGLFLKVLRKELRPQLEMDAGAFMLLPAAARMPARPVSFWELETGDEDILAAALRWWDGQDKVPVLIKSDSFYAGEQAEREDAKRHVADYWAARDGQRVVLRMLLTGRLGPYQAAQSLLRKASWLPLAVNPAVRLGFYAPGATAPGACAGCGGGIPENLLGEASGESCPRCADEAAGKIIAGLRRAGVLPDTSSSHLGRTLWTHQERKPRHTSTEPRWPERVRGPARTTGLRGRARGTWSLSWTAGSSTGPALCAAARCTARGRMLPAPARRACPLTRTPPVRRMARCSWEPRSDGDRNERRA